MVLFLEEMNVINQRKVSLLIAFLSRVDFTGTDGNLGNGYLIGKVCVVEEPNSRAVQNWAMLLYL